MLEELGLVLDGATLCLVLWLIKNRARVASRILDEPIHPGVRPRYRVIGPYKDRAEHVFYKGFDVHEAKAERTKWRDAGVPAQLEVDGEVRG